MIETETKSSVIEYPVLPLIQDRRSSRAFSNKEITEEQIHTLFEAARWAPSSSNQQSWQYMYATPQNSKLFNNMIDCLVDFNKVWASKAPLLIFSLAKNIMTNGKPYKYNLYDAGAANMQLLLQATEMGLKTHVMAGFDHQKARELFNLPVELDTVVIIAVGYPGNPNFLPEKAQMAETSSERNLQSQFIINPS